MKHSLYKLNRLLTRVHPYTKPLLKVTLVILFVFFLTISVNKLIGLAQKHGISGNDIAAFAKDPRDVLDSTDNLTNFLILGVRGPGDDSPDLTDTMIIASFDHTTKSFKLISIPRDLWVNSLRIKINAAYHYGNLKASGGGFTMAKAAIQETLGVPVHYSLVVNFNGFLEAIDLLGGVEINVTTGFTDKLYPIPGRETALPESSRYETVTFNAGPQLMDGATALKFSRSRKAEGSEGTDFARSKRQELLISALKDKALSSGVLLNQEVLTKLFEIAARNLTTDFSPALYPSLAKLALIAKDSAISSIQISSESDGDNLAILENPSPKKYDNQWVLIARDNNWPALKQYLDNRLKGVQ